jgi:hypothetical protein
MVSGSIIRRHEGRRKKAINMRKTTEVLQGPDEIPSQFYEWRCETFCLYTTFDREVAEIQRVMNAAFVSQAQEDIRQKLLKREGFVGMNTSWILEVATKVFVNQDQEDKWEVDRKIKRKVDLLAVALA